MVARFEALHIARRRLLIPEFMDHQGQAIYSAFVRFAYSQHFVGDEAGPGKLQEANNLLIDIRTLQVAICNSALG